VDSHRWIVPSGIEEHRPPRGISARTVGAPATHSRRVPDIGEADRIQGPKQGWQQLLQVRGIDRLERLARPSFGDRVEPVADRPHIDDPWDRQIGRRVACDALVLPEVLVEGAESDDPGLAAMAVGEGARPFASDERDDIGDARADPRVQERSHRRGVHRRSQGRVHPATVTGGPLESCGTA
jgi:hypothetical protein